MGLPAAVGGHGTTTCPLQQGKSCDLQGLVEDYGLISLYFLYIYILYYIILYYIFFYVYPNFTLYLLVFL